MTMASLAKYCDMALRDRRAAARAFLAEWGRIAGTEVLLDAATWRDEDVRDFEARRGGVLIKGRFGSFWFASPLCKRALLPPAPRLAPSAVVALAQGLLEEVQN